MGGSIVQLSESVVSAWEREAQRLRLRLAPAVVIRSEGVPGVDASTRWAQDVELVLGECAVEGEPPPVPFALNAMTYVDMVPVPLDSVGRIRLNLEPTAGPGLVLTAASVTLTLHGHGRYVAHLPAD